MNLNSEQKEAVKHFSGPCVVTAVPGSGKTSVLTARVVHLIKNQGINPRNILCTTFTNKAANEMRERVAKEVGSEAGKIFINTFHGLCLAILRKYGSKVELPSPFTIYSEKEQQELLSKLSRMEEYSVNRNIVYKMARAVDDIRENIDVDPEEYRRDLNIFEKVIVDRYPKMLTDLNAIDFSGMLYKCWELLKDEYIIKILSNRFKYVLVDEAQDMNFIQYDICRKIAPHRNLFFVCDYNQSIYAFRGARPEIIQGIKKDYPDVVKIVLPRNYRSTNQILQSAETLINNNSDTDPVTLISETGDGEEVTIFCSYNEEQESDEVVRRIQRLKRAYGYRWDDFAVLYRVNKLSKWAEMSMRRHEIPYKVRGGFSFFDRREIKTVLSYLNFVSNPHDTISFAKAISEPKRGVGNGAIGKLEKYCHENKKCIFEACQQIDHISGISSKTKSNVRDFIALISKYRELDKLKNSIAKNAEALLQESGYIKHMKQQSKMDPEESKRIENVNELLKGILHFETGKPDACISDYLNSVQIMTSDDMDEQEDTVSLMTMHASKGLEFHSVFIVGMDDKTVPHRFSEGERGEREERRLAYVAMTRAKSHLCLSYPQSRRDFSGKGYCEPSRFIKEANLV